ncbi:MAG: histidine--tRNA ligase [Candidatus Brocadiae bacterium]|nr:histidine--tRNA ligase [Candidatus Brocadiia bacterium]
MIQAPLGFEDHLPDRLPVWRRIEDAARRISETYGYREMRTPLMESTELFVRSVGEVTDIVEKEMFTFDKGDKDSLTLRPELTAPFVRACVEHSLFKKKPFQKLFYVGANFRKERPQKGRLRQFHQFGVEALGASDALLDAETVLLALAFFEAVGVPGVRTRVNTIGCPTCRPAFRDALKAHLEPKLARFCENCRRRFDRNVFRVLDCKVEGCVALSSDAPRVQAHLCDGCRAHDEGFIGALRRAGVAFEQDPRLVRGFDYYTRTVYEFRAPGLGAQDAIGGGGRYDNLIAEMGGDPAGAVGFAVGLERVVIALEAAGKAPEEEWFPTRVYVTHIGPETRDAAFDIVRTLRTAGISADMDFEGRSLKAQMRNANRVKAPRVVILGPDEMAKGEVKVRDMAKSAEESVAVKDLAARLARAEE